ncbi:MAG: arginase family protein [Desulfobacterales bacterium]|nr:arginase family protein [Desulfobacterales bacterium]
MPLNQTLLTPLFLDTRVPGLEALARPGWVLNKPTMPSGDQQTRMGVVHRALVELVAASLGAGRRPVSIAGDCCTAIAVAAGLQRAGVDFRLIWFDAHGDFNTPETSPSGFLGGMPLAMLVGRGDLSMPAAVGLSPLPENRIILTDGRDLDPEEKAMLKGSQVVHLRDPGDLLGCALAAAPLWVHFDVDVVALADSPAQNYPAEGGPAAAALQPVFAALAATGRLAAVSMSTWNPELDRDGRSAKISMDLLGTLVGEI